jgi:hypothetical protein
MNHILIQIHSSILAFTFLRTIPSATPGDLKNLFYIIIKDRVPTTHIEQIDPFKLAIVLNSERPYNLLISVFCVSYRPFRVNYSLNSAFPNNLTF